MKLSLITKAVLTTAALLVASTGIASAKHASYKGENYKGEACPPPPALRDGFYVGGSVGYDSYRIRHSYNAGVLSGDDSYHNALSSQGWVGGLFLGYGQYFTNWYLGGEAFGNYSAAEGSLSVTDLASGTWKVKGRVRGSWGLALLPGVKLSDTLLLYVRGGYTWANVKRTATFNGFDFAESSKTRGGWAYGVGMESLIWDNWSLRGEFTHTQFKGTSTLVSGYRPSDNQFMLGAVYHFA